MAKGFFRKFFGGGPEEQISFPTDRRIASQRPYLKRKHGRWVPISLQELINDLGIVVVSPPEPDRDAVSVSGFISPADFNGPYVWHGAISNGKKKYIRHGTSGTIETIRFGVNSRWVIETGIQLIQSLSTSSSDDLLGSTWSNNITVT